MRHATVKFLPNDSQLTKLESAGLQQRKNRDALAHFSRTMLGIVSILATNVRLLGRRGI